MKRGIAPKALLEQVKNTAGWLWQIEEAAPALAVLDDLARIERDWSGKAQPQDEHAYLRFLLTAHYVTVATFVPTDVDARIRHHEWMSLADAETLGRALDVVDAIAAWPAPVVSERTVTTVGGTFSGHDGEWFSVRAGALGRAIALGATSAVERLVAAIDAEVEREHAALVAAFAEVRTDEQVRRAMQLTTVVAHNLGDLSRVVEAWPKSADHAELRARFSRLGHADAAAGRAVFVTAGELNKELMARENHRFLPLRQPRALRRFRSLLLPMGPWFDAWGERVGRHEDLDERDRADVAAALVEIHLADPQAQGCLRALAGLHRSVPGGLDGLAQFMPARIRKEPSRGTIRDALGVSSDHFDAKVRRRFELARAKR